MLSPAAQQRRDDLRVRLTALRLLGCTDCGVVPERLRLLHFHHLDPATKLFNISPSSALRSPALVEAELAKCVVLCWECHAARHKAMRT